MGRTNAPTLWIPAAATPPNITPDSVAWTPSAWVTLTTGLPTPAYLTRAMVTANDGASVTSSNHQVQIATGASGAETIRITHRARHSGIQLPGKQGTVNFPFAYGPVPSGTRIAARVAHSLTADTDPYRVALGYQQVLGGLGEVTTLAQTVDPIDASTLSITPGTWPTWSAWNELLSAIEVGAAGIWIKGVIVGTTGTHAEVQIGIGSAGNEAAKATIPSGTTQMYFRFPHALFVPESTRVSARVRANSGTAIPINIWYSARA